MSHVETVEHSLALDRQGRYVKPVCCCGWSGDRRRLNNSSRAVLDGSHHIIRGEGSIPSHASSSLCSPTIFDWTRKCASCSCGWQGPWYSRGELSVNTQLVTSDLEAHRRKVLAEAWGDRGRDMTDDN